MNDILIPIDDYMEVHDMYTKQYNDSAEITSHFCDNPNCPNHKLPMNDERHYHTEDADVFGAKYSSVKTHSYKMISNFTITKSRWVIFKTKVSIPSVHYFNFCDICISAINMVDRKVRNIEI